MTNPPLAIVGTGRMGKAVAERAAALGWPVVAMIESRTNRNGSGISASSLQGAEVAIEFTVPDAAPTNVRSLLAQGCAVVSGTTGWSAELERIATKLRAGGGALFHAPNFSIGAALLAALAARAAELVARRNEFAQHIVETHHAAKIDAPSGTALMLARAMQQPERPTVPITSIRVGSVPGTHGIVLDAPFEQVRLEHEVRDRRVFADGALAAARWVVGRSGFFGMQDLIQSQEAMQ